MKTHRLTADDFREAETPTTRRFSRSLSDAFPDVRAPAVEMPAPPIRIRLAELAVIAISVACLLIVAVMASQGWLPGGAQ